MRELTGSGARQMSRATDSSTKRLLEQELLMFSLKDKVAVITGAASGIGLATALRFSKAGAKLVLADIKENDEIGKATGGIFVRTDVSSEKQIQDLMEAAVSHFGKLDVVVNNAGIAGTMGEIADIEQTGFDLVQNVNVKGVLWGIKHGAKHIAGGGSIINTASYAGLSAFPGYGSYTASKCAVIGLTKTAALELAPRGIRVNCVCPGTIDTPINVGAGELELALTSYLTPLGRIGLPEEVASLIHFLASDDSSYMTGLAIPIAGGISAGIGLGIIGGLCEMLEKRSSA
jgi:NAD(P)-dependent dehydrogenase (short-subunit alcohol dehydrogenase family)